MPDIKTQDGITLHEGDRAFNYYDHKPGRIERVDYYPQPNTMRGQNSSTPPEEWNNFWFTFRHDDGSSTSLDGSRICSIAYAEGRRWVTKESRP